MESYTAKNVLFNCMNSLTALLEQVSIYISKYVTELQEIVHVYSLILNSV